MHILFKSNGKARHELGKLRSSCMCSTHLQRITMQHIDQDTFGIDILLKTFE